MSSPFAIFRRNQRALMAMLTLAAMFTFVCVGFLGFGVDQLLQLIGIGGRSGPGGNEVVVKLKWGALTQNDLRGTGGLIYRRVLANNFVERVQSAAGMRMRTFGGFGNPSEEEVVVGVVLRHKAKEMGVVVDNNTVNQFLRHITGDQLTKEEFVEARRQMGVSEALIYSVLRDELLGLNVSQLLSGETPTFTPAELREYYHKMRDLADIEAVAVPAAAFLDQVEAPTEQQLNAYFARYRQFFDDPFSPMPGFRQQRRIQVEYVKADFEKTVAATTVSDEEVAKYYEENKDVKYRLLDDPAAKTGESEEPADDKDADTDTGSGKGIEADAQGKKPEQGGPESKPGSEKPKQEDGQAKPADDKGGQAASKDKPGGTNPESEVKPAEPPASPEPPSEDKSAEPAPNDCLPAQQSGQPTQEPKEQEEQPPAEKRASGQSEADTGPPEKPHAQETEQQSQSEKQQSRPAAQPRYRELDEELTGEIREQLQRQQARKLIDELFDNLQFDVFDLYGEWYADWQASQEETDETSSEAAKTASPPQTILRKVTFLGKEISGATSPTQLLQRALEVIGTDPKYQHVVLEHMSTPLLNPYGMSKLEGIGKARQSNRGEALRRNAASFVDIAYQVPRLYAADEVCETASEDELDPFSAQVPEKGNTYLFWKVKDEPAFEPKNLEQVREQVESSWRMREARRLARAAAKTIADVAAGKAVGLAESLADEKIAGEPVSVVHPPAFSWLSRPPAQMFSPPSISKIEGIEEIGEDFMRAAFDLEEGQVAVIPDAPENMYYVVRMVIFVPAAQSNFLRENFSGFFSEYEQLAQRTGQVKLARLVRKLYKEAEVDWTNREDL